MQINVYLHVFISTTVYMMYNFYKIWNQTVNIFIIIIVLRYNNLNKIIKTPRRVFSYSISKKHLNAVKLDFLRQNIF